MPEIACSGRNVCQASQMDAIQRAETAQKCLSSEIYPSKINNDKVGTTPAKILSDGSINAVGE
jgi:hypothetical protein